MIEQLKAEFERPGAVTLEPGHAGLLKLVLRHPSGAGAEVYLHGAHVASWRNDRGEEQLFLSRQSNWVAGQPIRGGVPVCWPQFGAQGGLPNHGLARLESWTLVATHVLGNGDVSVTLGLRESAATLALWPHRFALQMHITLSRAVLCLAMEVANTDDQPFEFQIALHSYFAVKDIRETAVRGLQGSAMIDKLRGVRRETDTQPEIRFAGETERVYLDAPDTASIWDSSGVQRVALAKKGMSDVVVWNPWAEKSRSIADFDDDDYSQMVCVESGNIARPVRLAAREIWLGEQTYEAIGAGA